MTEGPGDLTPTELRNRAQQAVETARFLESRGHDKSARVNWEAAERLYEKAGMDDVWLEFDEDDVPSEGPDDLELHGIETPVGMAMIATAETPDPYFGLSSAMLEQSILLDPDVLVDLSDTV